MGFSCLRIRTRFALHTCVGSHKIARSALSEFLRIRVAGIRLASNTKIGNPNSLLRRPRIDRVSRVAQHLLAVREIEIVLDHHAG